MFPTKKNRNKQEMAKKVDAPEPIISDMVSADVSNATPVPEPPKFPNTAKLEEKKPEVLVTEEQQALLDKISYLHKHYGFFTQPNDVANLPDVVHKAELSNLLMGIFCELLELRGQMQELIEEVKKQ